MKKNLFCVLLICTILIPSFGCNITLNGESNTNANVEAAKSGTITGPTENPKTETANKPETSGNSETETVKRNASETFPAEEKPSADGFETRCGWYANPTPGNHWLNDADGEWIIGVQGGHQAEGDYGPEFPEGQWVKTNGNYGYGCACFSMKVDKRKGYVLEIKSAKARPLSACRNDRALREPEE